MQDLGQASAHLKKLMKGIGVRGLPGHQGALWALLCLHSGQEHVRAHAGSDEWVQPMCEDLRAKAGMGQVSDGAGSK